MLPCAGSRPRPVRMLLPQRRSAPPASREQRAAAAPGFAWSPKGRGQRRTAGVPGQSLRGRRESGRESREPGNQAFPGGEGPGWVTPRAHVRVKFILALVCGAGASGIPRRHKRPCLQRRPYCCSSPAVQVLEQGPPRRGGGGGVLTKRIRGGRAALGLPPEARSGT